MGWNDQNEDLHQTWGSAKKRCHGLNKTKTMYEKFDLDENNQDVDLHKDHDDLACRQNKPDSDLNAGDANEADLNGTQNDEYDEIRKLYDLYQEAYTIYSERDEIDDLDDTAFKRLKDLRLSAWMLSHQINPYILAIDLKQSEHCWREIDEYIERRREKENNTIKSPITLKNLFVGMIILFVIIICVFFNALV